MWGNMSVVHTEDLANQMNVGHAVGHTYGRTVRSVTSINTAAGCRGTEGTPPQCSRALRRLADITLRDSKPSSQQCGEVYII